MWPAQREGQAGNPSWWHLRRLTQPQLQLLIVTQPLGLGVQTKMSTRCKSLSLPWVEGAVLSPLSPSLVACGSLVMFPCSEEVTLEPVQILAPLLPSCVTLGRFLNPSEPQLT